jgi:hypothetical protein
MRGFGGEWAEVRSYCRAVWEETEFGMHFTLFCRREPLFAHSLAHLFEAEAEKRLRFI